MKIDRIEKIIKRMNTYYNMDGQVIGLEEYMELLRTQDAHVDKTTIGDFWISTVLLYLDINFHCNENPEKRPVIFETMIFNDIDDKFSDYQTRYCTKEEALNGHKLACDEVISYLVSKQEPHEP